MEADPREANIPYITWDETSLSDLEIALKNGIEDRVL